MIFCGDISIPFAGGVQIKGLPDDELKKNWIGNLEGSLIDDTEGGDETKLLSQRKVFNSVSGVKELLSVIPFLSFGMANNHLLDGCCVKESKRNLQKIGIKQFGAGENIKEASQPFLFEENGMEYVLMGFGSKFINCKNANDNSEGTSPYNKWFVIEQMKKAKNDYPNSRIIPFFHWNNELELYPQPLDRQIAHQLIDMGAFAVIGCHAHRIQPIEIYKGRPIVYGLGNFAFRQGTYCQGMLKFPEFTLDEMAFEIADNHFYVHHLKYNPQTHVVDYVRREEISQSNDACCDLNDDEYKSWFKKNRYQRKALPVLFYEDPRLVFEMKYSMQKLRGAFIDVLVRSKKVFDFAKIVVSKIFR